ncbi:MAG: serine/threonine-protein kinase [Acidobacteriota bacterium]
MDNIGKYNVLKKIGAGGFAVVYKGFDPFIKRVVAIKVCYAQDEETRQRFHREAQIAGRMDHPNIATVYDFGIQGNAPYLVEEYLSGEDLAHKIKRYEPADFAIRIGLLIQTARGLAYAHHEKVIHRDIKPANIRILDDGVAKIMDFGTAKMANVESNLTQAGMTLGTVAYLPPERLQGLPYGPNSDIFSFGVTAYELLSFRRPFIAKNIPSLIDQVLNARPEPLHHVLPSCAPQLSEIVHRCLEKDPSTRYATMDDVMGDLERFCSETPEFAQAVIQPNLPSASPPTAYVPTGSNSAAATTAVAVNGADAIGLQVKGFLDRADALISQGKLDRARMLLDEVLELDPSNRAARELIARSTPAIDDAITATAPTPTRSPRPAAAAPAVGAPRRESASQQRARKITEAVESIRGYLDHGDMVRGAEALSFATRLLGRADALLALRSHFSAHVRNAIAQTRRDAYQSAERIGHTMKRLHTLHQLPVELAQHFVELAEELDAGQAEPNRILESVRRAARDDESLGRLQDRNQKQAEAVASIERLLAEGDADLADQALQFAIRLFGEFEQMPGLQQRIAQAQREV